MDRLVRFIQDKQVGRWCKLAAWIIVALGVVNIILGFLTFFLNGNGGNGYPTTSFIIEQIINALRLAFSTAITTIFYFFILYAAGALLETMIGDAKQDEQEEEDEDMPVNEALMPGQRLH